MEKLNTEILNEVCRKSFVEHLGIRFTSFDGKTLEGEIHISSYHLQPVGVVHGGVYLSFAETLAGGGSALILSDENKAAFGNTVSSQHLAPVKDGLIIGKATIRHQGIFKHIWDIEITDASGKLISLSRVTNSIKILDQKDIREG